ncbi:MAG: hypothetical protein GY704_00580, partial [Phycisphaeraceae bacterium]|nr:hypothetical protein [Phycisphaeraceae bacterium]
VKRGEDEDALAALDAGIQADDRVDLQDLPLLTRKIAIHGTRRDFRAMHEAAGALFRAMPEDDPDARRYVSHAFLALAEEFGDDEANIPHLEKFAVDCALRAEPDNPTLRQRSVDLREPARLRLEAEKALSDPALPDWIKMVVTSLLREFSERETAEHLRTMVERALAIGRTAFTDQWGTFRGRYPGVAEQAASVRRAIMSEEKKK